MKRPIIYAILLIVILTLLGLILCVGAVDIPIKDVLAALTGGETKRTWRYIILEARLPMAMTAMFAGAALSSAGLMMQTTFRNPLAGPSIMGVSSGASLGVALLSLAFPSLISAIADSHMAFVGLSAVVFAATVGAMAVVALLVAFSSFMKNALTLLIVGIMFSYFSSAVISLLNFFAPAEDVKSFAVWGMGSYMGVTNDSLPMLAGVSIVLLLLSILMAKSLNALLLGERYAANMGYSVKRVRASLLLVSGLLTAIVTAFCGPVGFIGLIVPHLARMVMRTSNHFILLPSSMLIGAILSMLCALITVLPSGFGVIPINAVTPIFGVPVIIYLLLAGKKLAYFN
jgi:iron complex transport system permease protein